MSRYVELPVLSRAQRFRHRLLRATTQLIFGLGMRPRVPVWLQRQVLLASTLLIPRPRGVSVQSGTLDTLPCEWLRGPRDNGWVILYLHGGAFMLGSPRTHRPITKALAKQTGARVCALDYRLAPEHPWPAAANDVLRAYLQLVAQGIAAERIVLAGDSAGGQLVLSSALRLRDLGVALPAALVMFSPVTDLSGATWHQPAAGDPMINEAWVTQGVNAYCLPEVDRAIAALSPLSADLSGLPPLLVQVAEDEHLLTHSTLLAEKPELNLRLQIYPSQWHVFQINCTWLPVPRLAMEQVGAFLAERGCQ